MSKNIRFGFKSIINFTWLIRAIEAAAGNIHNSKIMGQKENCIK